MPDIEHLLHLSPKSLWPSKGNARTHSDKQVKQLARSIERFGFTNPVLIDERKTILAGHGRVRAAVQLGLHTVPCVELKHLSAEEKRAYVVADNQLALKAGWDQALLATELKELQDLDFDVALTGFELPEIDAMIFELDQAALLPKADRADDVPGVQTLAVSRAGDLWRLGRHRLICGDAKDPGAYEALLQGGRADVVFTDPPYNVPISGHVSGLGVVQHREFAEASGEMSKAEFTAFLRETLGSAARNCRDGAIAFVCMDWRHLDEVLAAGRVAFTELKNLCVWAKTNAGMGTFYRSQHEMVLVWKVGTAKHVNTFGLGDGGRYRTNVWAYPGVNTFRAGRMDELKLHPTVKPVALVADAIRDVSNRGDLVLDVFGGSGTTLIAAEKTGRAARLIELDPLYCDVIVRRWEKQTGKQVLLEASGLTFEREAVARAPFKEVA